MEVTLGREQHAGLRLATVATIVPAMWTMVDRLNPAVGGGGFRLHPVVDRGEVGLGHHAPGDTRLVGDDQDPPAGAAQVAKRIKRSRQPFPVGPAPHILGLGSASVQDAVTIENDGAMARQERLGLRQSLQGTYAIVAVLGNMGEQAAFHTETGINRALERRIAFGEKVQDLAPQNQKTNIGAGETGHAATFIIACHAAVLDTQVVARVAVAIDVNRDHRRRIVRAEAFPHRREIEWPIVVAVEQQENRVNPVTRQCQAPSGIIIDGADPVVDVYAKARAVAEMITNDLGQITEQQQDALEPLFAQHLDQVFQKRAAMKLDHGLGPGQRERANRVPLRPPAKITA